GWDGATDPATLAAVLFDTGFGQAWLCRAVLALALPVLAVAWPRRIGAAASATGLLLASLALAGHAAMQNGVAGLLHRLHHAVPPLAGGFWLGALVPFLLCLPRLRDPELRRDAIQALRRFSGIGHIAVAAVLATGAVNAALVLGRFPTDWSSPY